MSRWSSARLSDRPPRSTQAAHPPKACGDRRGVLASAAANPAEDALEVEILQRIWCSLAAAASRRSPFTLMQFATVDENNAPKLRTIVVRGFDERTGRIAFSTNVGSRKVAELSTNRLVALVAFDGDAGVQLRIEGCAEIVADPAERKQAWDALRPHTHLLFRSSAPGTPLSSIRDGQTLFGGENSQILDPFEQFALVRVTLKHLDWLDISSEPHRRCHFVLEDEEWRGEWIPP